MKWERFADGFPVDWERDHGFEDDRGAMAAHRPKQGGLKLMYFSPPVV